MCYNLSPSFDLNLGLVCIYIEKRREMLHYYITMVSLFCLTSSILFCMYSKQVSLYEDSRMFHNIMRYSLAFHLHYLVLTISSIQVILSTHIMLIWKFVITISMLAGMLIFGNILQILLKINNKIISKNILKMKKDMLDEGVVAIVDIIQVLEDLGKIVWQNIKLYQRS